MAHAFADKVLHSTHMHTHTASYTRQHKLTRQVSYLPLTSPPLQGAYLILVARREAELQRVRSEVSADASRVRTLVLDVGKLDEVFGRVCRCSDGLVLASWAVLTELMNNPQIESSMAAATAMFGRIDVLVNNAGISTRALAAETSMEVVERVTRVTGHGCAGPVVHCLTHMLTVTLLQVDYLGAAAITRALVPGMIDRRRGGIINISSIAGKCGFPLRAAYWCELVFWVFL